MNSTNTNSDYSTSRDNAGYSKNSDYYSIYGDYESNRTITASASQKCYGGVSNPTETRTFNVNHTSSDTTTDNDKGVYGLNPDSLYAPGKRTRSHGTSDTDTLTDTLTVTANPGPGSTTTTKTNNFSQTANAITSHEYTRTRLAYTVRNGTYSNATHDGFSIDLTVNGSEPNHTWNSNTSNTGFLDTNESGSLVAAVVVGASPNGTYTKIGYGYSVISSQDVRTPSSGATITTDHFETGQGDYYGSGTRVGDVVNGTMSFDQSNYKSDTSQEISAAVHNFEQTITWMTVNKTGTYSANGSEQNEQWDPEIVTTGGHHIRDFNEWWCQVEDPTDCWWRPDPNNADEDITGGFPGSPPPSAGTSGTPSVEQGGGAAGKGAVRGIGQRGFLESLMPIWGSGRAAIDDCQNGRYGWCAFNAALAVSDVFMVGGLIKGAVKGIAKLIAREAVVQVASTGGHIAEASIIRTIQRGEKVADLISEVAARTWTSGGLEHAIVSLETGERVIVSGGRGGISFASFGINLRRVILHTHPMTTGVSDLDRLMLEQLGQRSSWIYELFGGGLTKFTRF